MRKLGHREVKGPAPGHTARIIAQIFMSLKPGLLISNYNMSKKRMTAQGERQTWNEMS